MKHDDLNIEPTLTPEEAVRLGGIRTVGDTYIVRDIHNAFYKANKDLYRREPEYYTSYALAVAWNAGRIEGIRGERARRRRSRAIQ